MANSTANCGGDTTLDRSARRYGVTALLCGSALATLALLGTRLGGVDGWHGPLTQVASTGFVLGALAGGARYSRYGMLLLGALACCWVGDVVGPQDFLLGAYAFLLAHLLLIPAFLVLGVDGRVVARACIPLAIVSIFMVARHWPHIAPSERMTVVAYTFVISAMVAVAMGTARHTRIIPIAAVLFYVSDLFVAQWRYSGEDWYGLICYPLYYLACILFASTVYLLYRQSLDAGPVSEHSEQSCSNSGRL